MSDTNGISGNEHWNFFSKTKLLKRINKAIVSELISNVNLN